MADMMLANDGSFAGAVWEPFRPLAHWILVPTDGLATVYVRYRDAAGNVSDTFHATILVDRPPPCREPEPGPS